MKERIKLILCAPLILIGVAMYGAAESVCMAWEDIKHEWRALTGKREG